MFLQNFILNFRIPEHLKEIYSDVFSPLKTSSTDFQLLCRDSKVSGIGTGDFVFREGDEIDTDLRYFY